MEGCSQTSGLVLNFPVTLLLVRLGKYIGEEEEDVRNVEVRYYANLYAESWTHRPCVFGMDLES